MRISHLFLYTTFNTSNLFVFWLSLLLPFSKWSSYHSSSLSLNDLPITNPLLSPNHMAQKRIMDRVPRASMLGETACSRVGVQACSLGLNSTRVLYHPMYVMHRTQVRLDKSSDRHYMYTPWLWSTSSCGMSTANGYTKEGRYLLQRQHSPTSGKGCVRRVVDVWTHQAALFMWYVVTCDLKAVHVIIDFFFSFFSRKYET